MSLYSKLNQTSFADIIVALKNSIGANKDRPYIAGKRVKATINVANTLAQTSTDNSVECIGAKIGDQVIVSSSVNPANSCWTGHVAANDAVVIRFNNYSASPINPNSADFIVTVIPS